MTAKQEIPADVLERHRQNEIEAAERERGDRLASAAAVSRVWDLGKKSPREQLDVRRALCAIDQVEDELWRITRPFRDPNAPGVEVQAAPNSATVAALKAILDSKWKRVGKTIPDLKAVELSGSVDSTSSVRQLTDLELLHRLQAVRRGAAAELVAQDMPDFLT